MEHKPLEEHVTIDMQYDYRVGRFYVTARQYRPSQKYLSGSNVKTHYRFVRGNLVVWVVCFDESVQLDTAMHYAKSYVDQRQDWTFVDLNS